MRARALLVALLVGGAVLPAAGAAARAPGAFAPEVVVSGLNNPRQVSFSNGYKRVLVAEAGRGGKRCSPDGCAGRTGSVTLVRHAGRTTNGTPHRIVRGLLSFAAPNGAFGVGSDGASARSLNRIYVAMTYAPPDIIPSPLPSRQAGKLLRADRNGDVRIAANITAVEQSQDPDGQGVDSNPYAVLSLRHRQIVADAAGNTLIEVRGGRARVLTVFPDHNGGDAVPTSLALGARGNILVGDLGHEKPGAARVWKVSPSGRILGWRGGFTTVTGVDVQDGFLYVSELFGGEQGFGQMTRVGPRGARTHRPVPLPAGVAVHAHKVYVAAWSVSDRDGADLGDVQLEPGQLWRFRW